MRRWTFYVLFWIFPEPPGGHGRILLLKDQLQKCIQSSWRKKRKPNLFLDTCVLTWPLFIKYNLPSSSCFPSYGFLPSSEQISSSTTCSYFYKDWWQINSPCLVRKCYLRNFFFPHCGCCFVKVRFYLRSTVVSGSGKEENPVNTMK